MRYGINTYVRDGEVRRYDYDGIGGVMLFGTRVFDGRALMAPHTIPPTMIGRPHEMVLRIGGVTYYPTRNGYELLD